MITRARNRSKLEFPKNEKTNGAKIVRARIGRTREKLQNTFILTNLPVRVEAKSISRKQNDTTTLVISNCSGE